jgi:biotin transporter BioY
MTTQGSTWTPRRYRLWKFLLWGALLGAFWPTFTTILYLLIGYDNEVYMRYRVLWSEIERISPTAWPTGILMLATARAEGTPAFYLVLAISTVANMVLYALGAATCWLLLRVAGALAERMSRGRG